MPIDGVALFAASSRRHCARDHYCHWTSAALGIPPAAAELAVIEVDRSSRRRVKKARSYDVAFLPASAPIWLSTAALSGSTRAGVI
jgi:hypothetical protein